MSDATPTETVSFHLRCLDCGAVHPGLDARSRCDCGGTLDVVHDFSALPEGVSPARFARRRAGREPWDRSGVWRFRELILPLAPGRLVTRPEGNTNLYASARLAAWVGLDEIRLKHEGENPTGSFKDRGMVVGLTMARALGMQRVACASTGNTAASLAAYAAQAGLEALVFVPDGQIAAGKLAQALAYGARTLQVAGDFDTALRLVEQTCQQSGTYLLNSVNPFRIEGQKAIGFELLEDLDWQVPDWIALPGGNLGNTAALGKGLAELAELGLIGRLPRLAVVQAAGANPLYRAWTQGADLQPLQRAETIASAIRIGAPVSWKKALRGLSTCGGVVEEVTDQQILDAKAQVDRAGIGAEPASCAAVAGVKKLVAAGTIRPDERVCCILTGHLLKDPDTTIGYHRKTLDGFAAKYANAPVRVAADIESVMKAIGS